MADDLLIYAKAKAINSRLRLRPDDPKGKAKATKFGLKAKAKK